MLGSVFDDYSSLEFIETTIEYGIGGTYGNHMFVFVIHGFEQIDFLCSFNQFYSEELSKSYSSK